VVLNISLLDAGNMSLDNTLKYSNVQKSIPRQKTSTRRSTTRQVNRRPQYKRDEAYKNWRRSIQSDRETHAQPTLHI